ncbi:serine hydrolase domain-containing protein [Lysobacter koreensis]|uniref:Serine hydrolase domain-containing protein n=1 Tax=Lysobacter koreensis TaxID=266122 RepID=A0ABW2YKP2_9GAMM
MSDTMGAWMTRLALACALWLPAHAALAASVVPAPAATAPPARAAQPAATAQAAALHAAMQRTVREVGVAGVAWATVDGDGTIATDAVGLANTLTAQPLRADSRVHIGSIAKTFIATGVLQLATAGRIELDAPVSRYLPALRFANPWPDQPVLVRHLLDHSAGLDDMRLWQVFSTQATPDTPLREAFTRDPSVLALRSAPGSQFSYSNMGYTLAAMVIEAVTRERYETWLDRELLRPLGMADSTFGFTTQVGPHADPRLAWGHHDLATPASALPVHLRPAGQFTTTVRDMALFARFLLGDGSADGRVLVRTDLLRAIGRASTTDAARAGLTVGNGLGLFRRDRHGAVGLCHGGDVVGFHAMLCVFPDPRAAAGGKAFVTVHNSDGDGIDSGRFDAVLVQALALPAPPALPAAPAPRDIEAWMGRYVPAPNRFASFRYLDFLFDSPRLAWDGARVRMTPVQGAARVLVPAGGHRLIANERSIASHALLVGQGGQRLLSDGQRTYRKVGAALYWGMAASLAAGLLGLLWFALGVPVRALLRREPALVPGVAAVALLLVPLPLFLLQSYDQLGDRTAASVALYAATAALPLLMGWQAWRALRGREGLAKGWVNALAALGVLQWCAVLAGWGMLPFALWR